MIYDELEMFLNWYMQNRPISPPSDNPVHCYEGLRSSVIYRAAPYQVELYTVEPNIEIPDHTHPNVDSFEVFLAGDIHFRHSGKVVTTPEMVEKVKNGMHELLGHSIRVKPNDSHGASVGKRGGLFLSVQRWNGEPHSVGKDWIDTETKETHNRAVK